MSSIVDISPVVAVIDRAIARSQEEIQHLHNQYPGELPAPKRGAEGAAGAAQKIEDLDLLVVRLEQLKLWIAEDQRMLVVIDEYVGQQVKKVGERLARQNVSLAVMTMVGGALLGWLLSIFGTPLNVLHLVGL